jgi:hypothetical protein
MKITGYTKENVLFYFLLPYKLAEIFFSKIYFYNKAMGEQ